jgi:hypothetical protein
VFILKNFKLFRINTSVSADSKEVTGAMYWLESNWVGDEDLEGVRRTACRTPIVRRARKNRADLTKPLWHIGTDCQEINWKWLMEKGIGRGYSDGRRGMIQGKSKAPHAQPAYGPPATPLISEVHGFPRRKCLPRVNQNECLEFIVKGFGTRTPGRVLATALHKVESQNARGFSSGAEALS